LEVNIGAHLISALFEDNDLLLALTDLFPEQIPVAGESPEAVWTRRRGNLCTGGNRTLVVLPQPVTLLTELS
jgi:hypothetical protein